jgi:RimJ/RimL family protein N-acetyltransferase
MTTYTTPTQSVVLDLPVSENRNGGVTASELTPPVPQLEGRRVRLRPVLPEDTPWLLDLMALPELGYQWRNVPGTLNPEQFAVQLWQGVLTQLLVTHKSSGRKLGLVVAYQPSPLHRTAYIAMVLDPGAQRLGWPIEGFRLFMRYVFEAYDLRKVYAEAIDYNLAQYSSLIGRGARREAHYREHVYMAGAYHDVYVIAFYRQDWL